MRHGVQRPASAVGGQPEQDFAERRFGGVQVRKSGPCRAGKRAVCSLGGSVSHRLYVEKPILYEDIDPNRFARAINLLMAPFLKNNPSFNDFCCFRFSLFVHCYLTFFQHDFTFST